MKKITWIIIGLAIALVFIFFPKDAGGRYGGLMSMDDPVRVTEIRSDCYGFLIENKPDSTQCADCGTDYTCFGILGKKHCYNSTEEVPC